MFRWFVVIGSALSILPEDALSQGCIPPPQGLTLSWDADDRYPAPNGNVWFHNTVARVGGPPLLRVANLSIGAGYQGAGLHFDVGAAAAVPHHPTLDFPAISGPPDGMSVELWIRGGAQSGADFDLFDKFVLDPLGVTTSGFRLSGDATSGHMMFVIGHGASESMVAGASSVTDGVWHHIAATFDASGNIDNLKLYVDGALDGAATTNLSMLTNAVAMAVVRGFVGDLDAISFYNRALDASEVMALHQASLKCRERFPARPTPSELLTSAISTSSFGGTLAIDGDVLAISQSGPVSSLYPFRVDIYRYSSGTWTFSESIADMTNPNLGTTTISLSGDVLAAGAGSIGTVNGGIYLYRYNPTPGTWALEFTDGAPLGGESVAVHGDVAILGKAGEHSCCSTLACGFQPYVKIYRFGGAAWSIEEQLCGPMGSHFGISVDVEADLVVVGAPLDASIASAAGAVYVYRRTAGVWGLTHTITPDMLMTASTSFAGWEFGRHVDLDGERLLVSAPGSITPGFRGTAFVIDLSAGGVQIEDELRSTTMALGFGGEGSNFGSGTGRMVQLRGERAVVGAPGDADEHYSPGGVGSAIVFARRNGTWTEVGKCMAGIGNQQLLGNAVVLDDEGVLVGAGNGGHPVYRFASFSESDLAGNVGTSFGGPAVANTTGQATRLRASGSDDVSQNNVTLTGDRMPPQSFGFFLTSRTPGFVANPGGSQGDLLLGGTIGRFVGPGQIMNSGVGGTFDLPLNLAQIPEGPAFVAVLPGESWNFQLWHRDTGPSGQQWSNFSDGLNIQFR